MKNDLKKRNPTGKGNGNSQTVVSETMIRCDWCHKENPMFWTLQGGFCDEKCYKRYLRKYFWNKNPPKK